MLRGHFGSRLLLKHMPAIAPGLVETRLVLLLVTGAGRAPILLVGWRQRQIYVIQSLVLLGNCGGSTAG